MPEVRSSTMSVRAEIDVKQLKGRTVRSATFTETGDLDIVFEDGYSVLIWGHPEGGVGAEHDHNRVVQDSHILWPKNYGTFIQDESQSVLTCVPTNGHVRLDVEPSRVKVCPLCGEQLYHERVAN